MKILRVTLLTIISLLSILPSHASLYDFYEGGIYYDITSTSTVSVTYRDLYYDSYYGDMVIPETVTYKSNTYSVAEIGPNAFKDCSRLTSVTIPKSVNYIYDNAFLGCSQINTVKIEDGETTLILENNHQYYPFKECNIENLYIGRNLSFWNAFRRNNTLKDVEIGNNVTLIGEGAFMGCYALTSVKIPNSIRSIEAKTFEDCSRLTSMTIPNSITSIGNNAFSGSGLIEVNIPNSVTSIGEFAFYDCNNLKSVIIPNSLTSIADHTFEECNNLKSLSLPNTIKSIGYNAFKDCTGLKSVNISDIDAWFNIKFGYNSNPLQYAGHLFLNSVEIKELEIPNSITSLGDYIFEGWSALTSVTIPNSVTSIGYGTFSGCSGLTSVVIPESVKSIGIEAFSGCSRLTSITIPESVKSIGAEAFYDCSNLAIVNFNAIDCKIIAGNHVFVFTGSAPNCTLVIGNNVKKIPAYIFSKWSGLTSVTIGTSVTSIGDSAFEGCERITSITIGEAVTTIGRHAFEDCTGLTSVTIPESVTFIDYEAFRGCSNLKSVNIYDIPAWCNIKFYNCYSNPLYFANHLFLNGSEITELEIPNSVTSIGDYAFYDCRKFTSVTIPESVTYIGGRAFNDCESMERMRCLNPDPTTIKLGGSVFGGAGSFAGAWTKKCILEVPDGSRMWYRLSDQWKDFDNVVEIVTIGVESIIEDCDKERFDERYQNNDIYYNLNGQLVENPTPGIYIANGQKIIVK